MFSGASVPSRVMSASPSANAAPDAASAEHSVAAESLKFWEDEVMAAEAEVASLMLKVSAARVRLAHTCGEKAEG